MRPMHNLLFTRDASMSINNEVLIGRMANAIRDRESQDNQHDDNPEYRIKHVKNTIAEAHLFFCFLFHRKNRSITFIRTIPVSYTHLDVYKRQLYNSPPAGCSSSPAVASCPFPGR